MKKTAIVLIMTFLICFTFILFHNRSVEPLIVKTVTLSGAALYNDINITGELREIRQRSLGVSRFVITERVYVQVGDSVKEGQVLATFSDTVSAPVVDADILGLLASADLNALTGGDVAAAFAPAFADEMRNGELVSPFDGIVTAVNITEGEQAAPFGACVTVSDTTRVQAVLKVSEQDILSLEVGMPVVLTGDTLPHSYDGVVTGLSPVVKSSLSLTGTAERYCEAVVEVYEPDDRLLPGGSVRANVRLSMRETAFTIPCEAVEQDSSNREYVYLPTPDGRVTLSYITTGREYSSRIEVTSGLAEGDKVIIESSKPLYIGATAGEEEP